MRICRSAGSVLRVRMKETPGAWRAGAVTAMGLILLAASACERPEAKARVTPPPPEVEVCKAQQRDVPIVGEWLGTAEGLVNAEVRSKVQGYLQSQEYTEGAVVKAGDPLYTVDARPFEASLAQAKADLAKAEAELGRTQLDVARLTPLAPSGAVSQQELDNARQQNEANKAAVEAAKAAVDQAALNVYYTKVISPIDGVAGISQAQVGDLVGGVGGMVLTTISTLDPIRVYFPISEQEYIRVAENINKFDPKDPDEKTSHKPLDLILSDGTLYPHKGVIDVINRQVDPTTGTIKIVAKFPNPGNILRPGQYARVRAVTRTRVGALLIPQRAVSELQGDRQVAVVGPENKIIIKEVTTGERIGSDWIIEKGVELGDRVVVEGVQKVRDGMTVIPKLFDPDSRPAGAGSKANTPAKAK